MPAATPAPRTIRPRWAGALLVCGKCVKRCPDGAALRRCLKHGARQRAASAREAGRGKKQRKGKVRIVRTACLGLCPKRALVVASPATLAVGEVILLRSEAEAAAALSRLLPGRD